MKNKILILASVSISFIGFAQGTWNTGLNSFAVGQNGNFGTLTDNSVLFKTYNTTRVTLGKDGKVTIADLAGDGDRLLMVDQNGTLKQITQNPSPTCGGSIPWMQGGNTIGNPLGIPNEIGTCDAFSFVLKANNLKSFYLHPSGKMGLGPNNNNVNQSAIVDIIDPSNSNTNHLMIYGDASGAVRSSADMGLYNNGNFGIYNGAPGSANTRFSIDATGQSKIYEKLDIGANMIAGTGARLGLDGQSSPGLLVIGNYGYDAIGVANSAGASRFRLWVNPGGGDDTKAHIAGNTQIGFYQTVGMADPTVRLNVDASGAASNGVKVMTNNIQAKTFYAEYNGTQTFMVDAEGKTRIGYPVAGTTPAAYWLTVNGKVGAREVMVTSLSPWPDYVFDNNYHLNSLDVVEAYIEKNKHLPNMPSAEELKAEPFGLNLGEMQGKQMEKIEEIFLHLIALKKEVEVLKQENAVLKSKLGK